MISSRRQQTLALALISPSYATRAERYARKVVSGKILACEHVRNACRRHLKDLKASGRAKYRWRFDEDKANRFCEFFECLPHVKDDFQGHALRGECFKLEDWQCFCFCSIFGWIDKKTGNRRFTEVYIAIPRKNGKTPMAAGVGIYMLGADGEYGAEVFAAATTKEQAWEVFGAALKMAQATPDMRKAFGIWCNAASIVISSTNSSFKPVKGKPADGPAPSCVLVDEYHEHKHNHVVSWARNGQVSRRQPLLFMITTAGFDVTSPCYVKQLEVQEVLAGRRVNERLFGLVYTVDEDVDWKSEKAVRMANPNLGISINPETIFHDQQQAIQSAAQQNEFKTKNLNIWVNQRIAWMNMAKWEQCSDPHLRIESFKEDPCIQAVDLASRKDTVSTARLFKRQIEGEWHVYCFSRHYLNAEQIRDPQHLHFQDWADRGFLIETPGNITDYLHVNDDLARDAHELLLREIAFDPLHAAPLIQFLQARPDWVNGVEISDLKQTEENMSAAMKEFEGLVLSGRFHFDGNPMLTWMIGNTVCSISRRENWYPVRQHVDRKIDGVVAIIIGLQRLMQMALDTYTSSEVTWV